MTGEVDLALYRPAAATNGNGVANATMIALYAEMERRHLGVFASNDGRPRPVARRDGEGSRSAAISATISSLAWPLRR